MATKTYYVLGEKKDNEESVIVKVKSTSPTRAIYAANEEYPEYTALVATYRNYLKLLKKYQKLLKKIKDAGIDGTSEEVWEYGPDATILICGNYISVESLFGDYIILGRWCEEVEVPLHSINEAQLEKIIEWMEEIVFWIE